MERIESLLLSFVEKEGENYKAIALPLRVCLIGQKSSPNIASVMHILGKDETMSRIYDILRP